MSFIPFHSFHIIMKHTLSNHLSNKFLYFTPFIKMYGFHFCEPRPKVTKVDKKLIQEQILDAKLQTNLRIEMLLSII